MLFGDIAGINAGLTVGSSHPVDCRVGAAVPELQAECIGHESVCLILISRNLAGQATFHRAVGP